MLGGYDMNMGIYENEKSSFLISLHICMAYVHFDIGKYILRRLQNSAFFLYCSNLIWRGQIPPCTSLACLR